MLYEVITGMLAGMRTLLTTLHSKFIHPSLALPSLAAFCRDECGELLIVITSYSIHYTKLYDAGFCLANDISERSYQIDRSGGQWGKGKGFDTFGPVA